MKKPTFVSWISVVALFAALIFRAPAAWADDDDYQRQLNEQQEQQRQAEAQQAEAQRQADWQRQQDEIRRQNDEQQRQQQQQQADEQRRRDEDDRQAAEKRRRDDDERQQQLQQQQADEQRRRDEDDRQAAEKRRRDDDEQQQQQQQQQQAADAQRQQQEADAQRRQQEADAQHLAADAQRRQQEADAQQHQPVQAADAPPDPKKAIPNAGHLSPAAIVHPKTAVAAVPAERATVSAKWLLQGVGALSVLLVAVPLVSLLVFRHHARQQKGPRVGRLVAVTLGPGPGQRKQSATAAASPAAIKRCCVTCGKSVKVIGGSVGKRFRCPGCRAVQTIRA